MAPAAVIQGLTRPRILSSVPPAIAHCLPADAPCRSLGILQARQFRAEATFLGLLGFLGMFASDHAP
jgi:hypothetical protein